MKVSELEKALRLELAVVEREYQASGWNKAEVWHLEGRRVGLRFALDWIEAEESTKKEAVGGQYPGSADDGGDPLEPGVNPLVREPHDQAAPRPLDDPA